MEEAEEKKLFPTLCCSKFSENLRKSPLFRYKVFYTICLYGIFFCMGWGRGQLGPSLADLQLITNVDLEKGSWIVTSFFIGCTIGSPIGGMLHDFMNGNLLFAFSHLIMAGTYFLIPWCSVFELMVFVYSVQGLLEGIVNPVGNAELIKIWKTHGKAIYLGVTVIFCLGGIIAPSVTAPFLLEKSDGISNATSNSLNTKYQFSNSSSLNGTQHVNNNVQPSKLYFAYSISGSLFLLISVMCFINYILENKALSTDSADKENKEGSMTQPSLPLRLKLLMLVIFSVLFFFEVGMDEVFGSFISTFCVKQLEWSKTDGAHVLSMAFIAAVLTGVCGMFVIKCLSTQLFTGLSLTLALIATTGLTIFSSHYIDIGVWITVPLTAFAKGNVFGLLFTWTNEFITPVTGKISSLYLVAGMIGSSVMPIVTGYLMEEVSLMAFCYVFVIQSLLILGIYAGIVLCTRVIVREYGTVSERLHKIVEDAKLPSEKLLTEISI